MLLLVCSSLRTESDVNNDSPKARMFVPKIRDVVGGGEITTSLD